MGVSLHFDLVCKSLSLALIDLGYPKLGLKYKGIEDNQEVFVLIDKG